ncbi:MAG: BrnT family toxin [Chloroflexi bacterium]|nr:BrnT family toxin [Chloroflexota bacterium]
MEFEWDLKKALSNLARHNLSFQEAMTVFGDPLSITVPDPDHSIEEYRFVVVGQSRRGRLLIVSYTERGDRIRIISARVLTRKERKAYEKQDFF